MTNTTLKWEIPHKAFDASICEMAIDGHRGNEGVALWLGRRVGEVARVFDVILLRGRGITKKPDLLIIDSSLINDVTDVAMERGLMLVGQIHSHGQLYSTNLSQTDRKFGVRVPGYLSVVAPDYGLRPVTRIGDCGVHVFEAGIGYRRLSVSEIPHRVLMTNEAVSVITVGNQ